MKKKLQPNPLAKPVKFDPGWRKEIQAQEAASDKARMERAKANR